uniref:Uncharacterized protein n=1 Tax=Populus trichocarpa TaxID=3694 RepID=A0A3N7EZY7_POPTR
MDGKHIVVVLPMRALCAKYQWHGTTEDVVNVQKASCVCSGSNEENSAPG